MEMKNTIPVDSIGYINSDHFKELISDCVRPLVFRNVDIGSCKTEWTTEYLKEKLTNSSVKVHVSTNPQFSFLGKNFVYKTLNFSDFLDRASGKDLNEGEYYYLRSIGNDKRGRDVANIADHFPDIASQLAIEELINKENFFSSVLRISSKKVQIWTHYDVMDNILVQIVGEKRVVLFNPLDVDRLYLEGDKSRVLNIDEPDPDLFPEFLKIERYECVLHSGDVLYIPSLWFHNTLALSFSIGVNMFWKNLPHSLYDKSDVYGNKDPLPASKALHLVEKALDSLNTLPDQYRRFYAKRALLRINSLL